MTVIDINERRRVSNTNLYQSHFSTKALGALVSRVLKILMHHDGVHGVFRQYCEPEALIERAKQQRFMLLDLGHVVRLYFGDDYFDLHLDTKVPYQRNEEFGELVLDLITEISQNDQKMAPDSAK